MKICLVKTSSMGDVLHTLPALTDAKRAIPALQVDWVVEPLFTEIPKWHSALNQVILVAIRRWRKNIWQPQTWQEWCAYKQQLQATQYDAVIDAQGLLKSALFVTHFARGIKYGYAKSCAREGLSSYFYDQTYHVDYQQHSVTRIRKLFALSLGYTLPDEVGDYAIADRFTKNSVKQPAYVLCFHATTRENKHWKEEYWSSLLKWLTAQGIAVRLPWGNALEKARAERLARISSLITVLPQSSLTEIAEQISGAIAVVSVDTGLSHLTAALDKTNIILYGATDPKLIGAYGKNQHYLSARSMANILPEQVFAKFKSLCLV